MAVAWLSERTPLPAGGGETGQELDISLLHVRLYHELWQGMLHNLTDETLRANSAVPNASPLLAASANMHAESAPTEDRQQKSTGQQDASPSIGNSASPQQGEVSAKLSAAADSEEVQRQQQVRMQSGEQATSSTSSQEQHESSTRLGAGQSNSEQASLDQSSPSQHTKEARASMSAGSCIDSTQLEGSWKVFDLAAVPIDETDVDTGECLHTVLTCVLL